MDYIECKALCSLANCEWEEKEKERLKPLNEQESSLQMESTENVSGNVAKQQVNE